MANVLADVASLFRRLDLSLFLTYGQPATFYFRAADCISTCDHHSVTYRGSPWAAEVADQQDSFRGAIMISIELSISALHARFCVRIRVHALNSMCRQSLLLLLFQGFIQESSSCPQTTVPVSLSCERAN